MIMIQFSSLGIVRAQEGFRPNSTRLCQKRAINRIVRRAVAAAVAAASERVRRLLLVALLIYLL